jgi:hypothetical protein
MVPKLIPSANLAIKCATYRQSNDGRKTWAHEPLHGPKTALGNRLMSSRPFTFSATLITRMCRGLYGEVCLPC